LNFAGEPYPENTLKTPYPIEHPLVKVIVNSMKPTSSVLLLSPWALLTLKA
jgi:hypothetical protein